MREEEFQGGLKYILTHQKKLLLYRACELVVSLAIMFAILGGMIFLLLMGD